MATDREQGESNGQARRRQPRRWYHPRKSDLAFLIGAAVFLWNGLRGGQTDPTIVYGSIALMGFSAVGRVDTWLDHGEDRDRERR